MPMLAQRNGGNIVNETQKRIADYKKKLPKLKEKVIAVALLLVIAIAMSTTVTFAWLVLARAPEVSGAATSVASNGNLEIALVGPEGYHPNATEIGDANKELIYKNITWGNLVNLTDDAYGLENLILRPARLNEQSLLSSPLYNATYSEEGRIKTMSSSFGYTIWDTTQRKFVNSNGFGVRAISSMKRTVSTEMEIYYDQYDVVNAANANARSSYENLGDVTYNGQTYSEIIANLMSLFLQAKINDGEADVPLADLKAMQAMYAELIRVYMLEVQAVADMLNFQKSLLEYNKEKLDPVDGYTAQDVLNMTSTKVTELKKAGYKFATKNDGIMAKIAQFVSDYNTLIADKGSLDALVTRGTAAKWDADEIDVLVNHLVNIGSCDLIWDENGVTNTQSVGGIGMGNAFNLLGAMKKENHPRVLVKSGILKNFDEYTGGRIEMVVTVPVIGSLKIEEARVYTNTTGISRFGKDMEATEALIETVFGDDANMLLTAEDTYALAIDLWVRTNAAGSHLTLEGNVLTETVTEYPMGYDINGNEVELYTITRKTGETIDVGGIEVAETETYDLYKGQVPDLDSEEEGATKEGWYLASTHAVFELEDGETPNRKVVIREEVIGYEGENRVWADNAKLSVDSTTQGSGSCYVFYVDAEDQQRTMQLLEAFEVVFIDGETGEMLSTAHLDTERAYSEVSKVTVPLALDPTNSDLVGDGIYAITSLERNVPRRITVLIYLDGDKLGNENVLAASEIQGHFNIQFGSSVSLTPTEDEKLMGETMTVTAEYTDDLGLLFPYSENTAQMTKSLKLHFDGTEFDEDDTIEAFFVRKINSTQGSRQESFNFEYVGGEWVSDYTFDAPGTYVLRSVVINGVEYSLDNDPTDAVMQDLTITGFEVTQASYDFKSYILSAANTYSGNVTLSVSAPANREPTSVRGIFERKGGTPVTVYFQKAQAGVWTGQATFVESGEYTLSYLIVDGESYPLPKNENVNMWKTVNITLGMSVVVTTTSPTNFLLDPMANTTEFPHMNKLAMQVKIYDNSGNPLEMLSDVQLNYPMTTSTTAKMNANLAWDATEKAYIGEFPTTPGTYAFGSVTVGDNIISRANEDAPVFTIIPPYEPKFVEIGNNGAYDVYQFGKGEVKMTFTDAPTAEAIATFVNKATGEEIVVAGDGVGAETKTFTFTIPADAPDGTWVLKTVGLSGVYVDNHFYGGEDGDLYEVPKMVEALNYNAETNTSAVVITVLRTVNVKFESVFNTNNPMGFTSVDNSGSMQVGWYGKTGNTISGNFMDSYKASAGSLKVVFTDGAGNPIDPHFAISNINLKYTYATDPKYGGYTSSSFASGMAAGTYSFTATGDGKTYQTSSDMTFQIAARYNPTLSYTITVPGAEKGQTVELTTIENAPVVEVWSIKPSAKITAVSPTAAINTKLTYTTDWKGTPTFTASESKTNSLSAYAATLYASATVDNGGSWGAGNRHGFFAEPSITITIYGAADGYTVNMTLPAGSATTAIDFSRTGNGTINKEIGNVSTIETFGIGSRHYLEGYTGHGSVSITTMTLTKDGVTYTVTLDNPLVINNPSSVNQ